MRWMILILAAVFVSAVYADEPEIPLWPNGAPGALGTAPKDTPTITPFIPSSNATGMAIVISMDPAIAHKGSRTGLIGENPSPELQKLMSSELQVTPNTPPCFLWHGADDKTVPIANSLRFTDACAANKVPFELHVYEHARH